MTCITVRERDIIYQSHIKSLTIVQSGWVMSCRREQALVVTELAPEHHSREKSHGSFTTHRFTDTFLLLSSLAHGNTQKHNSANMTLLKDYCHVLTIESLFFLW
uniref:Uncharacterized protein n=1 Tax=Oncorhynchus kisutch TaxID=8019 RepID=A0A8C7G8C1_ONCKI